MSDLLTSDVMESVKKVLLEREDAWHYTQMFDNGVLSMKEDYLPHYYANIVEAVLRPFSEKLETHEVKYPASWWQHFKKDVFPNWLLKRFPVIEAKKVIDIKAAYTSLSLPKEQNFVYIREMAFNPLSDEA